MGPQRSANNRMEFLMLIKTRIAALALAALALTGGLASTTTQAQAGGGGLGWGIGAGLIGAAVVGTAIAANNGPYYGGYRRCAFVCQFDFFRQLHRPHSHLQFLLIGLMIG